MHFGKTVTTHSQPPEKGICYSKVSVKQFCSYKFFKFLETLSVLTNRKRTGTNRLTKNSKIFKSVIKALQQKKGENIVSLDLRKIHEAVADFFVICEATSNTQVRALADHVEDIVKKECNENPYKHEGRQNMQWVLIDYVNIVVHIMQPAARRFYKLEEMWSDAMLAEHKE